MNSQLSFLFLIIALLLICISCDTTDPPDNKSLTLKLEDVSCTEAWITLTTTNLQLPAEIDLKQNNNVVKTINLVKADTLVYINSLLPNTAHTFQAVNEANRVTSNTVNVTTLDTTSQNFSFEVLEFGEGSTSYFNDVWVFDENNIWAVGDIDLPSGFTNFIQWDGTEWKARYPYITSSGIDGIWADDTSIIYFASGNILKYQNGVFENIVVPGNWQTGQRITKLWGSSESNIYGVGPWGTIVWYNGVKWTKIEYDTQWSFFGVTGNKETGVAYAVARNTNFSCLIVELKNSILNIIYNSDNYISKLKSYDADIIRKDVLILSDSDIWKFNIKTQTDEIVEDLPSGYYLPRLTSSGLNDVYFFGNKLQDGERMLHYSGVRVTAFDLPSRGYVIYGGAHSVNNLAAMAAFSDNKAYLVLVRR